MKSKSRKLALLVSALLTVSTLTGFATTKAASNSKADRVTLTVEVFDRSNAPAGGGTCDNNWLTQQIQKQFGDKNNINVKWIPLPRSQEVPKLNILMASGTAPDIVFTYNQTVFQNYADQGGLTDLTALYNKTTNLKKFEGTNIENGMVNGKIYAIPAKRSVIAKHVDMIRKDLLDKVGMKAPTNITEFEAVLKAFKKLGNGIIPYGLVNTATNAYDLEFGADHLIKSFVKTNISDQDLQTLPSIKLPGYKDGVAFLNKLYNEGLIDPDFALDQNDTKLKSNITTGKIGFYDYNNDTQWAGGKDSLEANLEKNVPGAQFVPINVFKNSDGKYMHSVYAENGYYIMVPKTSKNAEAAVKYLDWMSTTLAGKLLEWGQYGIEYKLDKNGLPDQSKADQKLVRKQFWNHGDLANLYNGIFAPTQDEIMKMMANDVSDYGQYAPITAQATKMSLVDPYRDYYRIPAFDKPIDAMVKYQSNLDTLYGTWMVKCIMAKTSDFDKTWNDFITEFMKNGGQEVQDAKLAAYKAMHKK